MATLTILEFIKLRKIVDATKLVKVEIEGYVLVGEFRQVYESLSARNKTIKFTERTTLVFTELNTDLSKYVFAWLDEMPSLIESIRLKYQAIKDGEKISSGTVNLDSQRLSEPIPGEIPKLEKIEKLYTEVYTELEKLSIDLDEYLQGLTPEPDLEMVELKVNRLRLLSNPELIYSSLFKNIEAGNVGIIDLLLWCGYSLHGIIGARSLIKAASLPDTRIAKLILRAGVDPNVIYERTTALGTAVNTENLEMVKLLVKFGAIVTTVSRGKTPLFVACTKGKFDIVKYLIDNGAIIDTTLETDLYLTDAHPADLVRYIVDHLKRPKDIQLLLEKACYSGYINTVKLLIEKEAIVNFRNDEGDTPLSIACLKGHVEIVKVLLKVGAFVDSRNEEGDTPLSLACLNGHFEIIKLLVESGANVNNVNHTGETPLHILIEADSNRFVHANTLSRDLPPELDYINFYPHNKVKLLEIIKLLIANGADVYAINSNDDTVIDLLHSHNFEYILEHLD